MKAFKTVFSFTFFQHCRGKAYKTSSRVGIILCLFLPALILVLSAAFGGEELPKAPGHVFVVDRVPGAADYGLLNEMGRADYASIVYHHYPMGDPAGVAEILQAEQEEEGLLLQVTKTGSGDYSLQLYRPEGSKLSETDVSSYLDFLVRAFPALALEKEGLSGAAPELPLRVELSPVSAADAEEGESLPMDPYAGIREGLGFVLPYVNIMLLYFMLLFYGQGVANSVLLEKTSKLMDSFLLHVDPKAMVLGKILAIAGAAIVQLFLWIAALFLSFSLGGFLVEEVLGKSLGILDFFHSLKALELGALFSPERILLSLLFFFGGFLLYCALASVGGSLAGKQEDLSSTNFLFTMALVASFFCCLYSGLLHGNTGASWLCYFPFTAILIAPSRLLLGDLGIESALLALALVLVMTAAVGVLAGKIYTLMAFYKGDPPKPGELIKLLRKE